MRRGPVPGDDAERWLDRLGPMPREVRRAMRVVPRESFVPPEYVGVAREDSPVPLPYGHATVSAPHMVALILESAELDLGQRVLDIGTGFGYLAALAAEIVGAEGVVHSVELEPMLVHEASQRIAAAGYGDRVRVHLGDGAEGWPEGAPYDRILCSCAVPDILHAWRRQLRPEGLAVAPVGDEQGQRWTRWWNDGPDGVWETGVACQFVPLRAFLPSDI